METLLPGKSMIFECYQCYVKITTLCLHIHVISMLKLEGADSSEVLLPSTKLHSVMSQNTIILILLRLLEPRIYSGSLFVQEMNIRKISRFCMLSDPIFIRDFHTVCLIVIKYNIASQVMNKTVKCVFLMIVT